MNLTVDQEMFAETIVKGTKELRQEITLYKKNDPDLALFRVTAANHIQDIILARVMFKKIPAKTRKWLKYWEGDLGIGAKIHELAKAIEDY
jgi:hypothetical protein